MDILETVTAFALAIALVILFSLVLALPTLWLWNWLIPSIFSLREITWGEAWGILVLSGILFRSSSSSKK